ncbi:putative ATP-grasp-modified RiPP [Nonomuraea zeae]|uniref:putative ATP-grasp-modified RiPP n=1 Tax=Nonomuraea zeae TaxID=1642303 RepID=UPI0036155F50
MRSHKGISLERTVPCGKDSRVSTDQLARPWGLGRMTQLQPVVPEYQTVVFTPETQLTSFYDAAGALVDMQRGTVTYSPGGGGDGDGSSSSADDSND